MQQLSSANRKNTPSIGTGATTIIGSRVTASSSEKSRTEGTIRVRGRRKAPTAREWTPQGGSSTDSLEARIHRLPNKQQARPIRHTQTKRPSSKSSKVRKKSRPLLVQHTRVTLEFLVNGHFFAFFFLVYLESRELPSILPDFFDNARSIATMGTTIVR